MVHVGLSAVSELTCDQAFQGKGKGRGKEGNKNISCT